MPFYGFGCSILQEYNYTIVLYILICLYKITLKYTFTNIPLRRVEKWNRPVEIKLTGSTADVVFGALFRKVKPCSWQCVQFFFFFKNSVLGAVVFRD